MPTLSHFRLRRVVLVVAIAFVNVWLFCGYQAQVIEAASHVLHKTTSRILKATSKIPWQHSIKPIAYIFPQYHAFPENDFIWGPNFTEWDNVRKVTHNVYGLETVRPTDEVGYYNSLELHTRQRQARFLRDSGFYGVCYHHYWFSGKPVMDAVLQQMLKDGEPNIPFMLSWANEPWESRWEGANANETFLGQDYGSVERVS